MSNGLMVYGRLANVKPHDFTKQNRKVQMLLLITWENYLRIPYKIKDMGSNTQNSRGNTKLSSA